MVYVPVATTGYMVYGNTVNINLIQNFTEGPLLIVIQVGSRSLPSLDRVAGLVNINSLFADIYSCYICRLFTAI